MSARIKNFFTKYWIALALVLVFTPTVAFMSQTVDDYFALDFNQIFTFSKFGFDNITISNTNNISDGVSLFIPLKFPEEVAYFMASSIGQSLLGTCSNDCSAKSCGELDGCGNVCVVETCGDGQVCSAEAGCVAACTPDCTDKECGDDGCGGLCGSCDFKKGLQCDSATFACTACTCDTGSGRIDCGNDACGNSCGTCLNGQICIQDWKDLVGSYSLNYRCLSCQPTCTEGICGSDGCGGFCGCPNGKSCDAKTGTCGTCTPTCKGKMCGDDGCGGSCGDCSVKNPTDICRIWDGVASYPEGYAAGYCDACIPMECDPQDGTPPNCGDDRCGGSCACADVKLTCGTWTSGGFSFPNKCVVCDRAKNCEGKMPCESDGCGGFCDGKGCDPKKDFCASDGKGGGYCAPCDCGGSDCGTNQCGTSCGTCKADEICTAPNPNDPKTYKCQTCPDEHLQCGFSHCGRYYGPCNTPGDACIGNVCKPLTKCDPKLNCEGQPACADDGCGGFCDGVGCDAGTSCQPDGTCQ